MPGLADSASEFPRPESGSEATSGSPSGSTSGWTGPEARLDRGPLTSPDPEPPPPGSPQLLDLRLDPDRYDPRRDPDRYLAQVPREPGDPLRDAARGEIGQGRVEEHGLEDGELFARAGGGRTLTDLLGDGAYEDDRETWVWAVGLLAVLGFLALASVVLSHLSPG